jgi:sugar diacid utilization regulator
LREDASPLSPSDLVILDYPLNGTHVALLLPDVAEGAAIQLAAGLRTASWTRDVLVHAVDLSSSVIWLGRPAAWSVEARQSLVDHVTTLEVHASVSDPRGGPDGVRETWEQVLQIERVRAAWGPDHSPRLLRHSDVSLEVLLLRDASMARRFVEEELGPLAEPNEPATRLRETLEASFRWGSHVTTAEHLFLHEHTVRNRLAKAGELLGRPLQERRTELQVALRLVRLLDEE